MQHDWKSRNTAIGLVLSEEIKILLEIIVKLSFHRHISSIPLKYMADPKPKWWQFYLPADPFKALLDSSSNLKISVTNSMSISSENQSSGTPKVLFKRSGVAIRASMETSTAGEASQMAFDLTAVTQLL